MWKNYNLLQLRNDTLRNLFFDSYRITVMSNIVTDNDDVPVVQSQPEFVSSNVAINIDTVDDSESPIPESKP